MPENQNTNPQNNPEDATSTENISTKEKASVSKKGSIVRNIIHVIIIAILLLGIADIIPTTITIPVGAIMLIALACWEGVIYLKNGRKKSAVFTFIVSILLAVILAIYFLLQTDLVK